MLVDLARNDLGKIAVPGTVTVDELLVLERYSHVTHLVSHVIAQQNPGASLWDVLQAIFPCGTITGCPKIRCLDILETLEQEDRGFYTGSLGYMGSEGKNMAFNILIRSLFLKPLPNTVNTFEVCFNTGAGIVDGAVASYEYQECLKKGSAILRVLYNCEHPGAEAVNLTL
jgi:anthranilate/para-aminobenzoate synthase component I